MVEEWNDDSVREILRYLPVKSLTRFKSVSKSWCSVFENPSFAHHHLTISRRHSRLLLIKITFSGEIRMKLFPADETPPLQHNPSHSHPIINLSEIFNHTEAAISSLVPSNMWSFRVSDGLFSYFDGRSSKVAIANMATREFKLLPELPLPQAGLHHQDHTLLVVPLALALHLNYFSPSNHYTVFFGRRIMKQDLVCVQYAIYEASTESWTELETPNLNASSHLFSSLHDSCFIQGVYYWVWFRYKDGAEIMILTFDLNGKVFREEQGPLISYPRLANLSVFEHQTKVWLAVSYEVNNGPSTFGTTIPLFCHDVWVMKGSDHDGHKWEKQFTVGPLSGINRLLRLWNNGCVCFAVLASLSEQLYLYDPWSSSGDIMELGTEVDGAAGKIIDVFTYEESLVKLNSKVDGYYQNALLIGATDHQT